MIERWPTAALDRLRWRDCFDPHSCPLFGFFAKDNIVLLVHKLKVGKRMELRNHECVICFLMLIFGSKCLTHEFHATSMKRMGGHGHDEPFYVHAKHMYNLDRMKHQKLKVTLGVLSAFSIGVVVPIYAVIFQQKKAASG
ncbi:unnamed protein product [Musa hybrid cultivar]